MDVKYFVVTLNYVKPLNEIDAYLPAHIEWLKRGYENGLFMVSGKKVPRTGAYIFARCTDLETLNQYLVKDPFQQAQLTEIEITEFEPSMVADNLNVR